MLSQHAWNTDYTWGFELTYYTPHFVAVIFILFLAWIDEPAKVRHFLRAALALILATILAHLDRWFNLWPDHLYFASGHMTFVFGVAVSMGLLRPWTFAITLPLLVPFGIALYLHGFHWIVDILGAIPVVLLTYGLVYKFWPVTPPAAPPLDMAPESP